MLTINPSEVIWTVINFFLLLFLLRRFLFKPILSVMDARKARIEAQNAEEESIRREISKIEADADRLLNDSKKEAEELVATGRNADQAARAELLKEAHEKAKTSRAETDQSISELRETEREKLEKESGSYAALLAARLMQQADGAVKGA